MTQDQAEKLGLSINHTWRNSPPPDIWAEELAALNYNQAEATYRKLRRESETSPSIARFLGVYHTLTQPEQIWTKPDRDGPPMSYAEYMDRLIIRAGNGDPEAHEMLDIWADNENRGLSITKLKDWYA